MILQPMKPAKLDLDKPSHQDKLVHMYESADYIAERKIDGCHYFNAGGRFLSTRVSKKTGKLVEKTDNFPHLVEAFVEAGLGKVILDGEIYYPHDEKSFGATKITGCLGPEAVRRQQEDLGWIYYAAFDVLRDKDGNWLIHEPWYKRREYLEQVLYRLSKESEYYRLVKVVRSKKEEFLQEVLSQGDEGIVLKHTQGIYIPGKRPMGNWVKLKTDLEDDVIITGYDPPIREYTGKEPETWPYWENDTPVTRNYYLGRIGSIRFGKYDKDGNLVELGSCTGLDDSTRIMFSEEGDKYIGRVITIKAMERTPDGKYRHPNFVKLHPDKNAFECVIQGV